MSERSDRKLAKQVRAVEEDSRTRHETLSREIADVGKSVSRTQTAVVGNQQAIQSLTGQSDGLRAEIETLAERVSQGFESLARSIHRMEEESRVATAEIVEGIRTAEESSRRGLQQISTSIAIGDALKAAAEAEEIEDGMAEAAGELEAARLRTELAIEEDRLDYDRGSREVHQALSERLSDLGRDVVELQDFLLQFSEETRVAEAVRRHHELELRRAQLAGMSRRERAVSSAMSQIDPQSLTRMADAQRSMEAFLGRAAIPAPEGFEGDPPGVGVPFVVVQAPNTEFNGDNGRGEVFGPDCTVTDCYGRHDQPPIPPELGTRIQRMCASLNLSDSTLEPDLTARLQDQMAELTRAGVLDPADAQLVVAHLDAHPLSWLESEAMP